MSISPVIFEPHSLTPLKLALFWPWDRMNKLPPTCRARESRAPLEAGTRHLDVSRDLRAAQIHVLEAGLVLSFGPHEEIAADLQGVGVERAVETGADHGDLSRDLRAEQNHVLEAGLVLAAECMSKEPPTCRETALSVSSKLAPVMSTSPSKLAPVEPHIVLEHRAMGRNRLLSECRRSAAKLPFISEPSSRIKLSVRASD